jgi:hypothetical protein
LSRRDNKNRFSAPAEDGPAAPQVASSLSISAPTEFVRLPTKGIFYPEEHPFHNKEEIEIHYMTARDEDILASRVLLAKGTAVDRFIQNILVDKNVDIDSLFLGDKNAIIVAARVTGYGAEYDATVKCGTCGAEGQFTFDLSDPPVKGMPEDVSYTSRGTFTVELPKSKFLAEMKLLTSREQKYLDQLAQSKRKNNIQESTLTDLLKMIIVSINSIENRTEIEDFINKMPAMDSLAIRREYGRINPSVDLEQDYECSSCGKTTALEVPLGADFFWPN